MMAAIFHRWVSGLVLLTLVLVSLFAQARPAQAAAPIYVDTWEDEFNATSNGKCSLREAVISANEARAVGGCTSGALGADVIILPANLKDSWGTTRNFEVNLAGTIEENSARTGDLDILDTLTIRGAGSALTTIASDGKDRVFHVYNTSSRQVVIDGVTITGGAGVDKGGGIYNENSTLYLRNAYIKGNRARLGGGIRNKILLGSGFGSTLVVTNTIISTNYSSGDGGGIDNDGILSISNSLISTNTAVEKGGGISNNAYGEYAAEITNTTVRQNIGVNGAGIYTASQNFSLKNSTVVDNIGTPENQAIVGLVVQVNAKATLKNTIIAGHGTPRQNCLVQTGAEVISNGHNLEDADECQLNLDGVVDDFVNTPAGLDSFGPYGSDTQLYGLLPGSAALDNGANEDCPSTDQRGINFVRPANETNPCDIGAFEADTVPPGYSYLPAISR